MAKRIRKKNIVEFDQVSQRFIIEAMIMCDTESDLPAIDEFENYLLAQGSLAIVIDTSDRYRITSDGTWNKNSSGGGSATLIEKSISVNGTYNASNDNADGYSSVSVSVPNTYTAEDEGKVVDNGSLVAQTAMLTEITANDTYDTTLYNSVTVNVPQGGSSESKDVNFYDYDGTIVASYTSSEFAELSSMPENPTHEGLTAQGWNWSLSDAKTYVASYKRLDIGQMYITSDGKTRIYITLPEGRTSPWLKLYLNANSEIDIDWGDESAHSTFTSTGADYKNEQHVYASAGDYVIAITVVSGSFVLQSSSTSISTVLTNNNNSASSPNIVYLNSIKHIEIGSGITSIGLQAFKNCYSLSTITIPDSVTSIEISSFGGCYSLSTITIPDSVTSIGNGAFSGCYSLSTIMIPDSVTSIGNGAFQGCYSLSTITIPDSVTSIGISSFGGCYSLSTITIPDSVTSIGISSFSGCTSLSSITIPDSVTSIGDSSFSGCYSLSTITIPDSVTSIESGAFQSCSSLSSITINKPEGSISGSPWGATTSAPTSTQIVWTG